jgi:hypothetical protein
MAIFPEHPWKASDMKVMPEEYWKEESNRKEYMEKIAKQLGIFSDNYTLRLQDFDIQTPQDWKKIPVKTFIQYGGWPLLHFYGKYSRIFQSLYPHHNWVKRDRVVSRIPSNYWNDMNNQKKFIQKLEQQLNIKQWQDWHNVRHETLIQHGAGSLIRYYGSMYKRRFFCFRY